MHPDPIGLFATESQSCLADIARAVGDQALQRGAHRLKGSSASVGALLMAELCERLCQAGRAGLPGHTPGLVEVLERTAKLTRAAWQGPPSQIALVSSVPAADTSPDGRLPADVRPPG